MSKDFLALVREFESMFGNDIFKHYNLNGKSNNSSRVLGFNSNIPSSNLYEDEWVYRYEIITPGITKENISIEINGDMLVFSAEITSEKTEKGDYVSKEYHYNRFHRTFEVPTNVVSDEIYAKVENGITTVYLPKEKPSKTKSYKRKVNVE